MLKKTQTKATTQKSPYPHKKKTQSKTPHRKQNLKKNPTNQLNKQTNNKPHRTKATF